MRVIPCTWPRALALLVLLPGALGDAVNRTIDDSLGDSVTKQRPTYFPASGVWDDETCSGCAIQPDRSLAFDGTWTAATYNANLGNVSVTFNFHGTAIYIFFILANNQGPGITTVTECNFTLDGTVVGHFLHQPSNSLDLQYRDDAMVFSKTGLSNENHTFQISTTGVNHDVFVNFDYAMYTFQNNQANPPGPSKSTTTSTSKTSETSNASPPTSDSSTSSPAATPTGAIVGGVVGGIALLAILVALLLLWRRRQRRQSPNSSATMIENLDGSAPGHSHISNSTTPNFVPNQTLSQQYPTSASTYPTSSLYTQSRYAPTSTRMSSEFGDSENANTQSRNYSGGHPTSYANRDIYSTLPSGQIVMGAVPQRQRSSFGTSIMSPALASSVALDNPFIEDSVTSATSVTTTTAVSNPAPLPPLSIQTLPASDSKAELRCLRQQELARQMDAIQKEMKSLQSEAAERHASIKSTATGRYRRGQADNSGEDEVSKLKGQVQSMHQQILSLQQQIQSPWAQGLSDEPPPGYSPR
ncbi:hypothetical protein K435DRAFT_962113 [Dendrothele bispora CBS 962.96]|uniref:Uncharacterized protein n=1 Tax=Dendrothele bispora (strain CBS 962.96) TaxID=1314807 RepID=A0A4S8MM48_DENBC|nr:hypothetical protein K435DRAFT_962113 [Dendrothele bispora CBS 962.96]